MSNLAERLPTLYTEQEAADALHVALLTLRRWRYDGKIGSKKIGKRVYLTEQHINDYLESCEQSTKSLTSTESSHATIRQSSTSNGERKERQNGALLALKALSKPK